MPSRRVHYIACKAVESNGITCRSMAATRGLCSKHYARWRRNGDFDRKYVPKAEKKKPFKEQVRVDPFMCICGHEDSNHNRKSCLFEGCDCRKVDPVNALYLFRRQRDIERLGFILHAGEKATCTTCYEIISIGRWHDPHVLQRALFHRRQSCEKKAGVV